MRYEELVDSVRNATKHAKISQTVGHVAYQFNVVGEAEGAFYLEIDNGRVNVEPYEYYDRDIIIVTSAQVIMDMVEGKIKPMAAYANDDLQIYGNADLLKILPL